ncbi:MAG TPA: TIGR01777 family oxidoreductase [Thermodesulfobacteriota bacterium]|nr:TIGR01777 family oxidoreductase [Thermodesulfobacteriota bacterium]
MKIFITGGTGFVGTYLTKELTGQGHQVTLLTRAIKPGRSLPSGAAFLEGNPKEPGPWQKAVAEHQAFINLAGASIFSRWTGASKKEMRESRILTTRNLVSALADRKGSETLLLSTSAIGYYGFHEDEEISEETPPGTDFLAQLCRDWEAEAQQAERFGVRVIRCRFGIVLGERGGALDQMIPLFKKGLGSPLGSGRQWFSWVHQQDLTRIFLFLLDRKEAAGPINCTAPHPVPNKELTRVLAEVLGRPAFLPAVPGFILKLIMGEFGDVLLKGQRVLPRKLLQLGFEFSYPDLKKALQNLLQK